MGRVAGNFHFQVCQWPFCSMTCGHYFSPFVLLHPQQSPSGIHSNRPNTRVLQHAIIEQTPKEWARIAQSEKWLKDPGFISRHRQEILFSTKRPHPIRSPPSLLLSGYRTSCPGGKEAGTWGWLLESIYEFAFFSVNKWQFAVEKVS